MQRFWDWLKWKLGVSDIEARVYAIQTAQAELSLKIEGLFSALDGIEEKIDEIHHSQAEIKQLFLVNHVVSPQAPVVYDWDTVQVMALVKLLKNPNGEN